MIDTFFGALATLLSVDHLSYMMLGVAVGLAVGVLPALGGTAGMSLLLPFIFGMNSTSAIAMMTGLLAVIPTADTFSSILMGIPGSAASQATVLDGFPLAKKGEAARALSASFAASMVGGLLGAVALTGVVVVARPLILSFGSAELFLLAIFGLTMVGILSGGSLSKGIAACALGLAFGSLGTGAAYGGERMTFGTLYLLDGFGLVIIGLGIFALPEIVDLLRSDQSISSTGKLGSGWWEGVKDTWKHRWLTFRCSVLGAIIGMVPGLGGSVVDWLAYGHAVQTSRDRSQFGKGDIRGVIAPESANNSCAGGSLIPTLLFGIPGSGSTALFLAAMILIGLQPGPNMADPNRSLSVTYVVVWTLAIANVVGTALCIVISPWISMLTTIRYQVFAPFMILIISLGAFQANQSYYDMLTLLGVGMIGIFLRRFGWSRPAFLIGFVLAGQTERYFYQAVQFYGYELLLRPLTLVILVIIILSVYFGARKRAGDNSSLSINTEIVEGDTRAKVLWPQVAFTGMTLAAFVLTLYDGVQQSYLDALFPIFVAMVGLPAALTVLVSQMRGAYGLGVGATANFDLYANDPWPGPWAYVAWIAFLVLLNGLVGFFIALNIFFVLFLRIVAKITWLHTVALTMAASALALVSGILLTTNFPGGLLQEYYYLPWPFR